VAIQEGENGMSLHLYNANAKPLKKKIQCREFQEFLINGTIKNNWTS
jgi:hypothetical protein